MLKGYTQNAILAVHGLRALRQHYIVCRYTFFYVHHLRAQGYNEKIPVCEHAVSSKTALPCTEEALSEHDSEMPPFFLSHSSCKMVCCKIKNCSVVMEIEI